MFNQVSIETGVDTPSNTANLMDATNTCAKGGLTPRSKNLNIRMASLNWIEILMVALY
jgi:hypothetical protein